MQQCTPLRASVSQLNLVIVLSNSKQTNTLGRQIKIQRLICVTGFYHRTGLCMFLQIYWDFYSLVLKLTQTNT